MHAHTIANMVKVVSIYEANLVYGLLHYSQGLIQDFWLGGDNNIICLSVRCVLDMLLCWPSYVF